MLFLASLVAGRVALANQISNVPLYTQTVWIKQQKTGTTLGNCFTQVEQVFG